MKKIVRLSICLTFLFALSILFSSFAEAPPMVDNNGVDVEIVKGETWYFNGSCDMVWFSIPTDKTMLQYKDGVAHLARLKFKLPEGNCFIPTPEEGAYKMIISGFECTFTPSGNLNAIYINNE